MGDLIDRQAAIDAFDGVKVNEEYCNEYDIGYNDGIDFAVSRLSVLPSARPNGKWIKYKDRACWYCSECREDNYYAYSWDSDTGEYKFQDHYCPNCGAEMGDLDG